MKLNEATRLKHQKACYKGQVNAKDWLETYLAQPDIWLNWKEKALTALNYLEARLDAMNYADFVTQSYPFGSG